MVKVISLFVMLLVFAAQDPPPQPPPPWRPPQPTNLQVLPKDTPPADVVRMMRSFTQALGVRCPYCHVGEGNDLSKFDFASDEKEHKNIARTMLRMTREINDRHLAGFPADRLAGTPAVTCYTCHRGTTKPLTERPQGEGRGLAR